MINGRGVVAPDETTWPIISLGDALNGLQRRSPYRVHEWRKQVEEECGLDWYAFDNMVLTSLVTRPHDHLAYHETYTDVICQSVVGRQVHGTMQEIVARFLVNVG